MQPNEDGFTLIEVLVVVALIGTISAIAIPVYKSYELRTHANAALSGAKALQSPIEAQILGVGSTVGTVGAGMAVKVVTEDETATITADREDLGKVTLTRASSGEWLCEHTFDLELKGCAKATSAPETLLSEN